MSKSLKLPYLQYKQQQLYFANNAVSQLAQQFGTPLFIYSQQAILDSIASYKLGVVDMDSQISYAVKANSNLAILQLIKQAGCGFDIVSGGELQRVLAVGAQPNSICFSGVGKTAAEMQLALQAGIGCFNVESLPELDLLNSVAGKLNLCAPISLRINPDVDAKTHPYISTGLKNNKFGIAHKDCIKAYQYASSLANVKIVGIDCHIGSQITEVAPFIAATNKVLDLVEQLVAHNIELEHIDFGGGLAIVYKDETVISPTLLCQQVLKLVKNRFANKYKIIFEPGRSIIGNAAICVTEVLYLKKQTSGNNFAIVDVAMNDMPRPAIYQSYHEILPVTLHDDVAVGNYNVVGPICESADFLGNERQLAVKQQDYLVIASAGAYCMSMSSNYNSRNKAAEILLTVDGKVKLIRHRDDFQQLIANEILLNQDE